MTLLTVSQLCLSFLSLHTATKYVNILVIPPLNYHYPFLEDFSTRVHCASPGWGRRNLPGFVSAACQLKEIVPLAALHSQKNWLYISN